MISASIGTFFWLSAIYVYIKYISDLGATLDLLFLFVVIIFMYFINVNIMQTKCGVNGSVTNATLIPWLFIFAPMMMCLLVFPEWKRPFSNTFGYMIARMAGGTNALLALLKPETDADLESTLHYVYNDPSLLINTFTPLNFNDKLQSIVKITNQPDETKINAFRNIIKLKDCIAEWMWYLLTASIVISTSYTTLMNSECTKTADEYVLSHNIAMADSNQLNIPDVTTYTINE
jgi:hypothetical protein